MENEDVEFPEDVSSNSETRKKPIGRNTRDLLTIDPYTLQRFPHHFLVEPPQLDNVSDINTFNIHQFHVPFPYHIQYPEPFLGPGFNFHQHRENDPYKDTIRLPLDADFGNESDKYLFGSNFSLSSDNTYLFRLLDEHVLDTVRLNDTLTMFSLPKVEKVTLPKRRYYQVDSQSYRGSIVIGLRSKNDYQLVNFVPVHKKHVNLCSINSDVPLVDSCLHTSRKGTYATVNADHTIKLWDKDSSKFMYDVKTDTTLSDALGKIAFGSSENTLVFLDRCCVYLIDERVSEKQSVKFCPKSETLLCESLCLFTPSQKYEHGMYISTTHGLFLFDWRSLKSAVKFMHMLTTDPVATDCVLFENKDVLCATGRNPKEKIAVGVEEYMFGPKLLSSSSDFIHSVHRNLDRTHQVLLEHQMGLETRGLKLIANEDTINVLYSNFKGEIFKQVLSKSKDEDIEEKITVYNAYMTWLSTFHPKLQFHDLCKNNLEKLKNACPKPKKYKERRPAKEWWKKSLSQLTEYDDVISKNLLEIWKDDDEIVEVGSDPDRDPGLRQEKMDTKEYVSNWLENIDIDQDLFN